MDASKHSLSGYCSKGLIVHYFICLWYDLKLKQMLVDIVLRTLGMFHNHLRLHSWQL